MSEHRQTLYLENIRVPNGFPATIYRPFLVGSAAIAEWRSSKQAAILDPTKRSSRILLYCLLLLSGDIHPQPGPPQHPCGLCGKAVKNNQKAIECEECLVWYHVNCTATSAQSYEDLGLNSKLVWICNRCTYPNFSTTFLLNNLSDLADSTIFGSLDSPSPSDPLTSPLGPPLHTSSPSAHHSSKRTKSKPRRKLKVLSLNCNSLKSSNKKAEFHALLDLHQPDVIMGCESKIDPSIPTGSVFWDKFDVFRKDRTSSGGGVFIAIRNDLAAVQEPRFDVQGCEIITASLQFSKTKKIYLSSFYNPSATDLVPLGLLDDHLSKLYSHSKFPQLILCGDFNCGGVDWPNLGLRHDITTHNCDSVILDVATKYGLTQHVKWPTRKDRILDLAFSSQPNTIQACHVIPGMSDHEAVLFEVDMAPKYTPKRPYKIYQYHKGDISGLRNSLCSFASDYLASKPERNAVEDNWNLIAKNILEATDKYIPHKMSKQKRHLPWVSPSVKRSMNRRDRAYKKAKRTGKTQHFDKYKRLRNITSKRLHTAHDKYVQEVMGGLGETLTAISPADNTGVKRAWSYLKLLRTESAGIPTLLRNNRVCSTDSTKAEALRVQYESVFINERLDSLPPMSQSPFSDMPEIIFTVPGIEKLLMAVNPSKASGPDQIPARILRDAAAELAPAFTSLFQQSFNTGIIPSAWKDANVSAIYKKGLRSDPANYRPISLTSLTCKIMEHVVCCHMSRHLEANSIISPHQHGFLRRLSCETQLATVIHDWAKVLNIHSQVDVVFLDFAKAFDSVPHERLLRKAHHYGFRGKLHAWLRCFLTDRRQRVVINGISSRWSPVKSGVPQGTVLGPTLFLLFINDMPDTISSNIKLFADDCVIYRTISSVSDHLEMQRDLACLENWAATWQMSFAPKKCMSMSITLKKTPSSHQYTLCNVLLERVTFQKYLGVHITSSLDWNLQCEEVKRKANKILGILQRNLSSCSSEIKARAYLSLVRPITEYATTAWSPHTSKGISTIESIQRRAARFVTQDYRRESSVTSMLNSLGWASLEQRRRMRDLEFFYKIENKLVDIPFPDDVNRSSSRTRGHSLKYMQPGCSIDAYKFSFFPRTIPVWNKLPNNVVISKSLDAFRAKCL